MALNGFRDDLKPYLVNLGNWEVLFLKKKLKLTFLLNFAEVAFLVVFGPPESRVRHYFAGWDNFFMKLSLVT